MFFCAKIIIVVSIICVGESVKKIEVFVATILVKISYYLTYFCRIKAKRISIISYFNDSLGLEFSRLAASLSSEYEVKYDLKKFNNSLWGKFKYLFSFIHQTYLFNTSRLVILDGNSFVYTRIKLKSQTKVMQLWHAIGAIKEFGSATTRRYDIKGYDYLITSSDYFKTIFAPRLNTKLSHTYALGNIKSDYLFDENYKEEQLQAFFVKYPQYLNKRIILYAPTFRGDGIEDITYHEALKNINAHLKHDEVLIIKKHPLIRSENKANDLSQEDLYSLMIVSDTIISDYSALVFEAMLLQKKIILYWYDYQNYYQERGFSIDTTNLDLPTAYNLKDLCDIIRTVKLSNYQAQRSYYLNKCDGQSLARVIILIKEIMDGEKNV